MAHYALEAGHGQGSQNVPSKYTSSEAIVSLPNSQQSSLNESSNSHLSETRPGSSGIYESSQGIMTPSTTLSNKSSQECVSMGDANEANPRLIGQGLESEDSLQSWNLPPTRPSNSHRSYTSAPKRTANGQIKSPTYSLPTSPVDPSQYGHSRNSSITSRGSQIGELSTQLKTRLSYAMVKVQHGWQSHNISELEHITSSQGSPISPASNQRRPPAFPIANGPSADYPRFMQPPARTFESPEHDSSSPPKTTMISVNGDSHKEVTNYQPPSPQVGASYESFWREHEGSDGQNATHARNPPVGGLSLAPPVDILARNSRRLDSTTRQPPALRTNDLHNLKGYLSPRTPSPKKPSKMRTPSQQAAVEKDAVETLLFMSSPGNSDYRPHTAPSGTPLRRDFTSHTSQTSQASAFVSNEARSQGMQHDGILSSRQQQPKLQTERPLSDADLNNMLDAMPDTSSSEDDDRQDRHPKRGLLAR